MAGSVHTEHGWKRQKQSACWLQPEWRVQCQCGRSPRLVLEPPTILHGSGSPLPRVSYRTSLVNLYANDLIVITESPEELKQTLILWKTNMEGKGLRVNMGKTKIPISGLVLDVLRKSGKQPCGVCLKGVGKIPFSSVDVPVGSTRNAVASLAAWSLMPAPGVNGALNRSDQ